MIHFWIPAETADPAEVLAWEPDLEPRRFANGIGHNLFELYVRLARIGLDVTAGEEVPPGTRLVVVFAKSVYRRPRQLRALRQGQRAGGRFAVVRSDAPLHWELAVRPVVEFMPIQAAVQRSWQVWLPPLPQRGLVPRREERLGRIRALTLKGGLGTVPEDVLAPAWSDELAGHGIEWSLDAPAEIDGEDQSWHDFSEVDGVLCVRRDRSSFVVDRKPQTRLINAWVAGCVPFADREPGYLELGCDGLDTFFVDTPSAAVAAIERLNRDPALMHRVEQAIGARAAEFAAEPTLARWRDALVRAAEQVDTPRARRARAVRMRRARLVLAGADWIESTRRAVRRVAGRGKRALLRRA